MSAVPVRLPGPLVLIVTLAVLAASPVRAQSGSGEPDCEMIAALGLAPDPACDGRQNGVVVSDTAPLGGKTRGLAIGGAASPPTVPANPSASPATVTPPSVPATQPRAREAVGPPPIPRARPSAPEHDVTPASPAPATVAFPPAEIRSGLDDIREQLADIQAALEAIREQQARLSREQAELRELMGLTRLREIGRLDGRIDQMTDLLERTMRHVNSRLASE